VNESDYEQAVELFYSSLYAFAYSLARSQDDACELTQETYARLLTKGHQVRNRSRLKSWLFTTLYRLFLAGKRRHSRLPHFELSCVEHQLPGVDPVQLDRLDDTVVRNALLGLEDHYRLPVTLFYDGRIERLDLMSRDVDELQAWLGQQNAPSDFMLPAGLAGRPALGCRVKEWNGQKVSLLCFELENREVAHLLVIVREALKDAPLDAPQFVRSGQVATVAWSRGDKIYLLASSHASESDLLQLL
jgi:hypothetical protein